MHYTLDQVTEVATQIIERARENKSESHATLITLSGDLGAGKTTLVQEIARQLGIRDHLQSPTFVIFKRYTIPEERLMITNADHITPHWTSLIHGDMYRLHTGADIEKLGWWDLLSHPTNIICIEWPEQVAEVIPDWAIKVTLTHKGGSERSIQI